MSITNPDLEGDVPHEVLAYLKELSNAVVSGDVAAAHALYENRLNHMTEQYFSKHSVKHQPFHPWPQLQHVEQKLEGPGVKALYQFIQHRSMFVDKMVKGDAAKASWSAFESLFERLCDGKNFKDLPSGWIWDIFDEFIFQLETVHIRSLKAGKTWHIKEAISRLEKVVDSTGIVKTIAALQKGDLSVEDFNAPGRNHLINSTGFYALISLMRIDLLLGDYFGVVSRAGFLGVDDKSRRLTMEVPAAHVSLYYTLGFSFMMMRRYSDASKMYRTALNVKAKHRSFVDKKQGNVVMLSVVTITLGNLPMEDLSSFMNDNNSRQNLEDDVLLLSQANTDRFQEVFMRCGPKFLTIRGSDKELQQSGMEAKELQCRVFMREVMQQVDSIKLRGYFRVYSTMNSQKAAKLLHPESSETERCSIAPLLCIKHKSRQLQHTGNGEAIKGEFGSSQSTDFVVDGGNVVVMPLTQAAQKPITQEMATRISNLNERIAALNNKK